VIRSRAPPKAEKIVGFDVIMRFSGNPLREFKSALKDFIKSYCNCLIFSGCDRILNFHFSIINAVRIRRQIIFRMHFPHQFR
jgi:hypothetical protein